MNHKPHYPLQAEIKRKAGQVANAMHTLARLGIEARTINVEPETPVITVFNCPANKRLQSEIAARGNDHDNLPFVIRAAHTDGCKVTWTEFVA
jgi:hypothetical protein